ncbi:T9SS type A sorting domain-containing protein, partial [candidate division KSB1 bacterium]|nr:T9SS type A sorting domain-containing protein [candidate division KSB1 bacterium]
ATGTVWFDDVGCGSDPWSMWPFNGDFETSTGWMMWAAGPGAGFANTVKGPAHSGEWSALLVERDAADDEMVFYSEPAPAESNKWYMISVWAKTDSANANPKFLPSNVAYDRDNDRMGLCFFFHKGFKDSWDLTPPGDMFGYFNQRDSSTEWTQYIYAVKAPAEEVAGISVRARFNSFPQGYCWYDDFAVHPFEIKVTAVEGEILSLGPRMPESHAVVKNYPNPFNPETTVEYYLPKDGVVELAIYNMLGQKVRTVVNDFRLAGTYKISWNGLDQQGHSVPSGIYFIRLVGKDFQVDHKILLIK